MHEIVFRISLIILWPNSDKSACVGRKYLFVKYKYRTFCFIVIKIQFDQHGVNKHVTNIGRNFVHIVCAIIFIFLLLFLLLKPYLSLCSILMKYFRILNYKDVQCTYSKINSQFYIIYIYYIHLDIIFSLDEKSLQFFFLCSFLILALFLLH